MSTPEQYAETQQDGVRSSVKCEQNAKGAIQVKVSAYDGVTVEEMQRLSDLAVDTLRATIAKVNGTAGLSTPTA